MGIDTLKSRDPIDFPDRLEARRGLVKYAEQAGADTYLKSGLPVFISDLDYSYEAFHKRATVYGEPARFGNYRDKIYGLSKILWAIGEPEGIKHAIQAMSSLIYECKEREEAAPSKEIAASASPYICEIQLLEEMRAGNKYPNDWPERESAWRWEHAGKAYNSTQTSNLGTFLIVFIVIGVLFIAGVIAYKYFQDKASNSVSSVETAYIVPSQLNLRAGPGTEHGVITKLSQGNSVICLSRTQSADGNTWVRVRAGSFVGWVNQKHLSSSLPDTSIDEFEVHQGNTLNGFTYSSNGTLTYSQKSFSPGVSVNTEHVSAFKVSFLKQRNMAAAIAIDSYGHNKLFLLDLNDYSSTPMQEEGSWSAAQEVFWSPSQRYMVAFCSYEGERFEGFDLNTKRIISSGFMGPDDRIWRISKTPHWLENKDVLVFNVNEHCNYYDDPCDPENILAAYEIRLNAASLRYSYTRISTR
jgi:hypothetical protein